MENREQRKGRLKVFKMNNPQCSEAIGGTNKKTVTLSTPKRVEQVTENRFYNYIKFLLNMKQKMIFLALMLWMLSTASANAQVLIGGNESDEPHSGAILDLSFLGDKNLGLLLPNVELGATATDFTLAADATDEQKTAACGMIVYNTKTDALNGAGLYVWTGSKWMVVALAGS
jgi:hypothetical protein